MLLLLPVFYCAARSKNICTEPQNLQTQKTRPSIPVTPRHHLRLLTTRIRAASSSSNIIVAVSVHKQKDKRHIITINTRHHTSWRTVCFILALSLSFSLSVWLLSRCATCLLKFNGQLNEKQNNVVSRLSTISGQLLIVC